MNLISAVIGRCVVDVVLHVNEPPAEDIHEKGERFDVNCKIDDGSQINIEMQSSRMEEAPNSGHANLKGKSIYYLTDLYSSQPAKGETRYDKMARTYQITFCSYTIFPNMTEYVNGFSMRHDQTGELLSDALHVTFVELSKLEDIVKKPVSEMTNLDKWSVFFEYASDPEHRESVNEVIESEEVLQMAGNLLMSISTNERERAIYRSRRKYQTDMQSNYATARDNGKAERSIEIARNLLKINLPLDQIALVTGLTIEEVNHLQTGEGRE